MRLALHTDFALRTLMFLAGQDARANIGEIADFFGISKDHLAKVAQRLAREGFIRSMRGVGGGLELARPAEEITIGEVIERFEGSLHLLDCVAVDNVCRIQPGCGLRTVLIEAERVQRDYLNSVKLSDVVQPGRQLVQLLELT
ncbi:MAG: Rrf2 family transcriptional regulator [Planctomycetaceae bacterium]|nr:Rrf2 family transcriptional regulator [Planctomycetaceae bacterium]